MSAKERIIQRAAFLAAVVCTLTVAVTTAAAFAPAIRTWAGWRSRAEVSYPVGRGTDVPPATYAGAPFTLLIFARSDCGVCEQVKPWLAAAVAAAGREPSVRVVVLATGAHAADDVRFAGELGVDPDHVVSVAGTGLRVNIVPTVVLVDRHGLVRYSQEGAPRTDQGQTISEMMHVVSSH